MNKLNLYIDSSILGWSLNKGNSIRFKEANLLLKQISDGKFTGACSWVTEEEVMAAPEHIAIKLQDKINSSKLKKVSLNLKSEAEELAEKYCVNNIVPYNFKSDSLHIAIATLWHADALVSYNFQHIVNLKVMVEINKINKSLNLKEIFLCQPQEVLFYES